jgi:hypothetical protein
MEEARDDANRAPAGLAALLAGGAQLRASEFTEWA